MIWDKDTLLRQFSLVIPGDYHPENRYRKTLDHSSLRASAVLIGFVQRVDGLHILMTRRADHLRHHPGQVSFPGGKMENKDKSLLHTALRETYEEIGITPDNLSIFGQLPHLITRTGFEVKPALAFVSPAYQLVIDHNEVSAVFEVPLSYVLQPQNWVKQEYRFNQQKHSMYSLVYQNHLIWGATAQMLYLLKQQLRPIFDS